MSKDDTLFLGAGNAKLDSSIATFSIPAGHSCPGALHCMAKSERETGKLTDGAEAEFRCYSATAENIYNNVRRSRWRNFDLLRAAATKARMRDLILRSIENLKAPKTKYVRIHVGGDFFSMSYFQAWVEVAEARPDLVFYAYTKSVHLWVKHVFEDGNRLPSNFRLTASRGGKFDHLIDRFSLKSVVVVTSPGEAEALGIDIDKTDEHAYGTDDRDFALLIHSVQAKGSKYWAAMRQMKEDGVSFSYSDTKA